MPHKKIGLLIGDEIDWPQTFMQLVSRLNLDISYGGKQFQLSSEPIRIEPFNLTSPTSYSVVIDRLAYWHLNPREWLKKAALIDRVYLLNNPFTFQSMEKHTAYCAMQRLGLHIPETWLVPSKQGPQTQKYEVTAQRWHDLFSLPEIAEKIGYPLYMKPFDGGGWRGVSRIKNEDDLMRAYDESGDMLMHLQAGLEDFEVFARSLAIGPQVSTFKYDPDQPQHGRYVIEHGFLSAEKGREAQIITKTINAFFGWDFNSCEAILKNGILSPIDFANACPDIAVTSLHYYYPWAIKALVAWSVYCAVTERKMRIGIAPEPYFEIADSDRSYEEKLDAYEKLADEYLETEAFAEFKDAHLGHLDEVAWQLFQSADFDQTIIDTVRAFFPDHEHDQFIAHYRGLMRHWVDANPA